MIPVEYESVYTSVVFVPSIIMLYEVQGEGQPYQTAHYCHACGRPGKLFEVYKKYIFPILLITHIYEYFS